MASYARFRRALSNPGLGQNLRLQDYLRRNELTAFGKAHHFGKIQTYEEFVRRVPLSDYSALQGWIERIRQGEPNVLTSDLVTHLIPTSGTSTARKLIPFTKGLQAEFNAAIAPWVTDLVMAHPSLLGGPAYWSVTPVLQKADEDERGFAESAGERTGRGRFIPIGFDNDSAYVGGARAKLVEAAMAVPPEVQHAGSIEAFRYCTLLFLLRCRELRLISVWHPSFLTLLLEALPVFWKELLNDIENGWCSGPGTALSRRIQALLNNPLPTCAAELRDLDPRQPAILWPKLRVVSCWGDAAAGLGAAELRRRLPGVVLQPKGLMATEAFISLPFRGQHPLAICSHLFEFLDDSGQVHLADALTQGEEYEVVVTTAGGLWRYRLGDRVRVVGSVGRTPAVRFVGRVGIVSDQCGEKLTEPFVTDILHEAFGKRPPAFALLAPDHVGEGCGYALYVQGETDPGLADRIDHALSRNPHYAYCRRLGQLQPVRIFVIRSAAYETFVERAAANGARIGDIKPASLSKERDWSQYFEGNYLAAARSLCDEQQPSIIPEG